MSDVVPVESVNEQVAALRRELKLIWDAHEREHVQHEASHAREHQFAQQAIDTAAVLAKENKADANEWRGSMTDRERRFATKDDIGTILGRLDSIERASLVEAERDRQRLINHAEERQDAERRQGRQQWTIGIAITFVVVLVNLAIRLL